MINRKPLPASPAPLIMALEPRILLDGAAVVEAAEAMTDNDFAADSSIDVYAVAPDQSLTTRREVVFVDASLPDVETLIDGLDESAEVYLIEAYEDGLAQMIALLEGSENLDAIHILGHGDVAQANIGSTILSDGTLDANTDLLKQIGSFLSDDGDILLYGCNIAQGAEGEAFVERIAQITQADIAASDDLTGDEAQGGDWDLEDNSGLIETTGLSSKFYSTTLIDPPPVTINTDIPAYPEGSGIFQPIVDGKDITSGISNISYSDGRILFTLTGDEVPDENIRLMLTLNSGDITFDPINNSTSPYHKVIYQDGDPIGSYFQNDDRTIDVELNYGYYNGSFDKGSNGWEFTAKSIDNVTGKVSSDVEIASNTAHLYGSGFLNSALTSFLGSSFNSINYIPLTTTDSITFNYTTSGSSGDDILIYAYLEKPDGTKLTLINGITPASGSFDSADEGITIAKGDYRLVIQGGIKENNASSSVQWDINIDHIEVNSSTTPSINQQTVIKIANSITYYQPSFEDLRQYPDTTLLDKQLNIKSYAAIDLISAASNLNAQFQITPINDKPYGDYTAKGTVPYSTPGEELDIFNTIKLYPEENNQTIKSITMTIDGIFQASDEYLVYDDGTNPIYLALDESHELPSFNNIDYTITLSPDLTNNGREVATIVFSGNWVTQYPSWTTTPSYSSTLTTFLDRLKFKNNAINTTDTVDRKITITKVVDSGSDASPNSNTFYPNYSTIIHRLPVLTVSDSSFSETTGTPVNAGNSIDINNLSGDVSIVSATVRIIEGYTNGDTLFFDPDPTNQNFIPAEFIVSTGTDGNGYLYLTLTSNPDNDAILLIPEWKSALSYIKFDTVSDNPTNRATNNELGNSENLARTLRWEINDGLPRYIPEYSTITINEQDDGITQPLGNTAAINTPHNTDISFDTTPYFEDLDDVISFSSPDLPAGLIINSTGEITGKLSGIDPAEFINGERSYTSTIIAQNSRPDSQSITLTITVTDESIDITSTQPDLLMSQNSYNNFDISGYFSDSDDTLEFDADNLPPGLTINSTNGIISGNIPTIPDNELTPDGKKTYTITVYAKNFALDANGLPLLDSNNDRILKDIQSFTFEITVSKESLSITPWSGYHFDENGNPITISSLYKAQNPNETSPTFTAAGSLLSLFKEVSSTSLTNGEYYSEFNLKISNISASANEFIVSYNQDIAIQNGAEGTLSFSNGNPVDYTIEFDGTYHVITFTGEFTSEQLNNFINSLGYRNDNAFPEINNGRTFSISVVKQSDGDSTTLNNTSVDIKRLPALYISDHNYNEGNSPTAASDNIYLRNIPVLSEFYGVSVQITENYQPGESLGLLISDQNPFPNIQASFNPVSGTLSLVSSTPLLPPEMDQLLNKISFHSTLDYNNSSELTRTLTWTVHADPNEIDRYQPETSNLKIIPVLGLTNDTTQVGNTFEKNTANSFTNFGDGLIYSATGLPEGITIDSSSGLLSGSAELEGDYDVVISIETPEGKTANDAFKLAVYPQATPNTSSNTTGNQFTQYQQIDTYNGERTGSSSSTSTSTTTSSSISNTTTTDTRTTNTADSSQSMTYSDSGLTSETTTNSQQQASESNTEAAGESENSETNAEASTASNGVDTSALSETSLNTTENAAATLASVFDSGVPNRYAASLDEIRPPAVDKISISVNARGQLLITSLSGANNSDSLSGMTIVDVEQLDNSLNIRINDIELDNTTRYSASLPDGRPVPAWLSINPDTGELRGEIPPGTSSLDLRIQAVDEDGTIRILEIQLSFPNNPEPLSFNLNINDVGAEPGFGQQLASASQLTENSTENIIQALNAYKPS